MSILELGEACKVVTTAYKSEPWFGAAFRESILSALCDFNEVRHSPMLYVMASKIAERIFDLSETQDSIIKKSLENHQTVKDDSAILDSGNRTEFPSGAVRDIQKGKGRPSLMPLDVVAYCVNPNNVTWPTDQVLWEIANFQKTGRVTSLGRAIKYFCTRANVSPPAMMLEVAVHFEQGAEKYGENNWCKGDGIPESSYIDSAVRHYLKWLDGWEDERHDRAFVWNVMCLWWTHDNVTMKGRYDNDD